MKPLLYLFLTILMNVPALNAVPMSSTPEIESKTRMNEQIAPPEYLFKILSKENWEASKERPCLILSSEDDAFIHLATEGQLKGILDKFWSKGPEYRILKLGTCRLIGRLVYEANPGGSNKYYHLYEGNIPADAVIEVKSSP